MKKHIKSALIIALAASQALAFCGCAEDPTKPITKMFGKFDYYGVYLTEYAVKAITYVEAKAKVLKNHVDSATVSSANAARDTDNTQKRTVPPSEELVNQLLARYSECKVTTTYYDNGETTPKTKTNTYVGMELRNMIANNYVAPYAQMYATNIIAFDDLIDYMDEINATINASSALPFDNYYTYHLDSNNNFIVHASDFSEISSSTSGGISTTFRQDTEIVYGPTMVVSKWQTSLGLNIATPNGDISQGYILEMDFDWTVKTA